MGKTAVKLINSEFWYSSQSQCGAQSGLHVQLNVDVYITYMIGPYIG